MHLSVFMLLLYGIINEAIMTTNSKNHKSDKINITLIGITALIAILLIVWIAIDTNTITTNSNSNDVFGQASLVINENIHDSTLCSLIVSQSESSDSNSLAVGLQVDSSTYYSGHNVLIKAINADGCMIDIDGNADYVAVGQIQKIGSVYVTIKDISG